MTNSFHSLFKISTLSTLLACDCFVTANGIVKDNATGKPMEGVLVKNLLYSELGSKTNADGEFNKVEIGREKGKCLEFNLEFSKDGYLSDTIFIKNSQFQTIFLKQKK
jgi:hypothetical protein